MLVCGADGQRIASLVSWLGCSVVPGVRKGAMKVNVTQSER